MSKNSCCKCLHEGLHPPVPPPELLEGFDAKARWREIGMFSCCSYVAVEPEQAACKCCPCGCAKTCTWCPNFCPQAVHAPCIALGQNVTLNQQEEPCCCGSTTHCTCLQMGKKGWCTCCFLAPFIQFGGFPPGAPANFSLMGACLTAIQRHAVKDAYGLLEEEDPEEGCCKVFCCYPCAIWKSWAFLYEANYHMRMKKKDLGGGDAEGDASVSMDAPTQATAVKSGPEHVPSQV